tara:strand:+ start:1361 stop:1603 length:243 start_codon:yes stop_codon:yes gene_type:complete
MKLILQLFFLSIVFFLCLRYDLKVSYTKSISRAILFALIIGIIHLLTQNPSIEGWCGLFGGYGETSGKWQDDNNIFSRKK